MTVPSGSVARKGLTPSDRNRLEVGVGLTLCVLSGPLPAPSTQSSREVKTALQCLSRFGRIPWEPGVCREASAQTAPVSLRQPLQLGHVRAALCLSRPRGQDWGGASSPGQPRSGGLIEVRWIAQPLWSLLPPPVLGSSLVWAQEMVGAGHEGLHAPQEELYVDHGWRDLLHHVGDEVEFVPWAGQLVETYTGRKNQVH